MGYDNWDLDYCVLILIALSKHSFPDVLLDSSEVGREHGVFIDDGSLDSEVHLVVVLVALGELELLPGFP